MTTQLIHESRRVLVDGRTQTRTVTSYDASPGKLHYFQLNYYAAWERGFPVGLPVETHEFVAPHSAVAVDGPTMFAGADLDKAAQWARNLGFTGTFGIEETGV